MNKKLFCSIFWVAWLLLPSYLLALSCDSSLAKRIDQTLLESGENLNIGIVVQNLSDGKILYSKNADRYFTPASNQKLLLAYAALRYLGSEFSFSTGLFADKAKLQDGVLKGDLYLQFSGDPTLGLDDLEGLVKRLPELGIHKLQGNIIIDDSSFDDQAWSPGTAWDDRLFCYGSPMSALILEHNCIYGQLQPAVAVGLPAILQLPSRPQFMNLQSQVLTQPTQTTPCKLNVVQSETKTYTIKGCIKSDEPIRKIELAINDPRQNTVAALKYLLQKYQFGGTYTMTFGKLQPKAKLLAAHGSQPLPSLLKTMLKDSDNTIANALFKTLGARYFHTTGTWQNGAEALAAILTETSSLEVSQMRFFDGDGASRYNFLTPRQILTLLQEIYLDPHSQAIVEALPIAGIDGTLKERMKDAELRAKVRAKTGTETGVSALSGYLVNTKGQTLAFSIMSNGFIGPMENHKALEDRLCQAMIQA